LNPIKPAPHPQGLLQDVKTITLFLFKKTFLAIPIGYHEEKKAQKKLSRYGCRMI
jgi:hypothetical protein